MPYSDWILFAVYVGGYLPAWSLFYTQFLEIDRWCRKEDSSYEATIISFFWPVVIVIFVLYLVWRVFRASIIGLANLMQRENSDAP